MSQNTIDPSGTDPLGSNPEEVTIARSNSGDETISNITPSKPAPPEEKNKFPKVSLAAPRFWHGMRFTTFLKLLWNGGFRIHFLGLGMCIAIFFYSICNSILSLLQSIVFGSRIAKTEIKKPPVFIVGHWRSGTTLVHELMSLDDELTAPTTFQCFVPNHFMVSSWFLKPIAALVIPKKRPMDNMESGPDRPQEDEFAYCALGAASPYAAMAFPNQPRPHQGLIDMTDVSEKEKKCLADSIRFFVKSLTFHTQKRLVLKSPTHTGRIDFLRQLYPDAKFIHITRDPKSAIPSTVRLWTRLDQINGFQIPNYDESSLQEYVGETFSRMYKAFEEQSIKDDPNMFTVKYEDVVQNPTECLRAAYDQLGLEGFDKLSPKIESFMKNQSDYKKNEHQLDEGLRNIINNHCATFMENYGYQKP